MTVRECLDGNSGHRFYDDGEAGEGERKLVCGKCGLVAYETANSVSLQSIKDKKANRHFSFA